MLDIFVVSDNICSPLGWTSAENFSRLKSGVSGVKRHDGGRLSKDPFYASLFPPMMPGPGYPRLGRDPFASEGRTACSPFERLLLLSIEQALQNTGIHPEDRRTIFILSTTKGNIQYTETIPDTPYTRERASLHASANVIGAYFDCFHMPIVVSNACISGIVAILTAIRLIRSGRYDHAVVAGADLITKFIFSGFQAFQAISGGPCRPFDRDRDGINLGEGAGTVILSANPEHDRGIRILGGAVTNDANHLSAPSRSGEELAHAITRSLDRAHLSASDIDFISAHGTATPYNDEMEAKAINLAGLSEAPVNSLKGYFGHTLGAAGLIESIVSIHSLREGLILPSPGFENMGVSHPVHICSKPMEGVFTTCLKTASGFGGCNAALLIHRHHEN